VRRLRGGIVGAADRPEGRRRRRSSDRRHSSMPSLARLVRPDDRWCERWKCWSRGLLGEESQQPTCPQNMHSAGGPIRLRTRAFLAAGPLGLIGSRPCSSSFSRSPQVSATTVLLRFSRFVPASNPSPAGAPPSDQLVLDLPQHVVVMRRLLAQADGSLALGAQELERHLAQPGGGLPAAARLSSESSRRRLARRRR